MEEATEHPFTRQRRLNKQLKSALRGKPVRDLDELLAEVRDFAAERMERSGFDRMESGGTDRAERKAAKKRTAKK